MVDISYVELENLIRFFYSADYDDHCVGFTDDDDDPPLTPFEISARMFALGDRYDIPLLRRVAVKKYTAPAAIMRDPIEFL